MNTIGNGENEMLNVLIHYNLHIYIINFNLINTSFPIYHNIFRLDYVKLLNYDTFLST